MERCAEKARLTREALDQMLSETSNPDLRSIRAVLQANGIRFSLTRNREHSSELATA